MGANHGASPALRKRSELLTTNTLAKAIAAAANIYSATTQ